MGKPALHQPHWCIQEATWRHPLDLQLRASLLGGIQDTAREDGEGCTECFCPEGREGRRKKSKSEKAGHVHSRPHASFSKGISSVYSSEEVSDKRLCMSLLSESWTSFCTGLLLAMPATQEEVAA